MKNAKFIEVSAGVRYWEDAEIDGSPDDGGLIFGRIGDRWSVKINLETGEVSGWPSGVSADIHYKVCDDGEYWLLDDCGVRIKKWSDYYVPNEFLCVGGNGYGDYIIMKIKDDGFVPGWRAPLIEDDEWANV